MTLQERSTVFSYALVQNALEILEYAFGMSHNCDRENIIAIAKAKQATEEAKNLLWRKVEDATDWEGGKE